MEFITAIIILIILFCVWDWLKRTFLQHEPSKNHEHPITVICPYCHSTIQIHGEGLCHCESCKQTFEYQGGYISKHDDTLPLIPKLIVELFAKIAKVDGVVTKEEIRTIDYIIREEINPDEKTLNEIRSIFNNAKSTVSGYKVIIHKLYDLLQDNKNARIRIIQCLQEIAEADHPITSQQDSIILYTVNTFHLARYYETIKANAQGPLDVYYKILGCTQEDSLDTIKRNYRKLIKEYHPDKYINKDLPKDFIQYANKKIQDIQEAYEKIVKYKTAN